MKKTTHYKGHRWTNDEIRELMQLWAENAPLEEIAKKLCVTTHTVSKQVVRLRHAGIPLERRKKGHTAGKSDTPWTQGEVEYLLRARQEKQTSEQIAMALGRTWHAVSAMIQKLRKEGVSVGMRGCGVRRLWDPELLKGVSLSSPEISLIEINDMPV